MLGCLSGFSTPCLSGSPLLACLPGLGVLRPERLAYTPHLIVDRASSLSRELSGRSPRLSVAPVHFTRGNAVDLRLDCTQNEARPQVARVHSVNLPVKCKHRAALFVQIGRVPSFGSCPAASLWFLPIRPSATIWHVLGWGCVHSRHVM